MRAEHQAFYRRVFGHRLICDPRHYPSLTKPISLMALDYAMARERVVQRYPFFRSTFFERRMLFARAPAAWLCARRPEAARLCAPSAAVAQAANAAEIDCLGRQGSRKLGARGAARA